MTAFVIAAFVLGMDVGVMLCIGIDIWMARHRGHDARGEHDRE